MRSINPAFTHPSRRGMRGELVNEERGRVEKLRNAALQQARELGLSVTLLVEIWESPDQHPICAYFAVIPGQSFYLCSALADEPPRVCTTLAGEVDAMLRICPQLNAMVTGRDLGPAQDLVLAEHPDFVMLACASYALHDFRRALLALEPVRRVVQAAQQLSTAVMRDTPTFQSLRVLQRPKHLRSPIIPTLSLWGSAQLCVRRLLDSRDQLMELACQPSCTLPQPLVEQVVTNAQWWQEAQAVEQLLVPLEALPVDVEACDMRLAELFEACLTLPARMRAICEAHPAGLGEALWHQIDAAFQAHWVQGIDQAVLQLIYVLHPHHLGAALTGLPAESQPERQRQLCATVAQLAAKLFPDSPAQEVDAADAGGVQTTVAQARAVGQLLDFRSARRLFDQSYLWESRKHMPVESWWSSWSTLAPELSAVALRVLSLPSASAASAPNWDEFQSQWYRTHHDPDHEERGEKLTVNYWMARPKQHRHVHDRWDDSDLEGEEMTC